METITCVDCGELCQPDGPSFHNLRPGYGPSMWVCEDCRGQREHMADALGMRR